MGSMHIKAPISISHDGAKVTVDAPQDLHIKHIRFILKSSVASATNMQLKF